MTLKEQMAQDIDIFLDTDELAVTVSYNGTDISAILEIEEDMKKGNTFASDGQSARAVIHVACADISSPSQGDEIICYKDSQTDDYVVGTDSTVVGGDSDSAASFFTNLFAGYTWQVARILNSDGYMHKLELIANESPW